MSYIVVWRNNTREPFIDTDSTKVVIVRKIKLENWKN